MLIAVWCSSNMHIALITTICPTSSIGTVAKGSGEETMKRVNCLWFLGAQGACKKSGFLDSIYCSGQVQSVYEGLAIYIK